MASMHTLVKGQSESEEAQQTKVDPRPATVSPIAVVPPLPGGAESMTPPQPPGKTPYSQENLPAARVVIHTNQQAAVPSHSHRGESLAGQPPPPSIFK